MDTIGKTKNSSKIKDKPTDSIQIKTRIVHVVTSFLAHSRLEIGPWQGVLQYMLIQLENVNIEVKDDYTWGAFESALVNCVGTRMNDI